MAIAAFSAVSNSPRAACRRGIALRAARAIGLAGKRGTRTLLFWRVVETNWPRNGMNSVLRYGSRTRIAPAIIQIATNAKARIGCRISRGMVGSHSGLEGIGMASHRLSSVAAPGRLESHSPACQNAANRSLVRNPQSFPGVRFLPASRTAEAPALRAPTAQALRISWQWYSGVSGESRRTSPYRIGTYGSAASLRGPRSGRFGTTVASGPLANTALKEATMHLSSEGTKGVQVGDASRDPSHGAALAGIGLNETCRQFPPAPERSVPDDAFPAVPPGEFRHVEHGW